MGRLGRFASDMAPSPPAQLSVVLSRRPTTVMHLLPGYAYAPRYSYGYSPANASRYAL